MLSNSHKKRPWLGLVTAAAAMSCVKKEEKNIIDVPFFHQYTNVRDSDAIVQKASRAVVRVNKSGTGFFINSEGVLLTNEHILGPSDCYRNGCVIKIDARYQLGEAFEDSQKAFAVPLFTNTLLDVAALQLYLEEGGEKLSTPDFLELTNQEASATLDEDVAIVGHPHGGLKKVVRGKVSTAFNTWFRIDKHVLGGNSGSPILNTQGQAIGILHSGSALDVDETASGMGGHSNATASAPIRTLLGDDLMNIAPDEEGSLERYTPFDVSNLSLANLIFDAERVVSRTDRKTFDIGDESVHIAEVNMDSCQQSLTSAQENRSELASLRSCVNAIRYSGCFLEDDSHCPEDRDTWVATLDQLVQQVIVEENYTLPTAPYFYVQGRAIIAPSEEEAPDEALRALDKLTESFPGPLDLRLAYAASTVTDSYRDRAIGDIVAQYHLERDYAGLFPLVWRSAINLFAAGAYSEGDIRHLFGRVFGDPKLSIGHKFEAESDAYEAGLL